MAPWAFVTNHGAVLSLVSQHRQITAREIATRLGITERSVHRIITDLEDEGYLRRQRMGRLNLYVVDGELSLRTPAVDDAEVAELLKLLNPTQRTKQTRSKSARASAG